MKAHKLTVTQAKPRYRLDDLLRASALKSVYGFSKNPMRQSKELERRFRFYLNSRRSSEHTLRIAEYADWLKVMTARLIKVNQQTSQVRPSLHHPQ
jgi:hypothetical protein